MPINQKDYLQVTIAKFHSVICFKLLIRQKAKIIDCCKKNFETTKILYSLSNKKSYEQAQIEMLVKYNHLLILYLIRSCAMNEGNKNVFYNSFYFICKCILVENYSCTLPGRSFEWNGKCIQQRFPVVVCVFLYSTSIVK